ncbi:MAG: LysR family transcriptional regulator [Pseudomonadales bacterium]
MDTQNLKAFISVSRHLSFSQAAEDLHLTQPAVSKRISLIEQDLGLTLFDRIGRKVSLTEHGERLIPLAKDILQRIEATREELQQTSTRVMGRLSLSISHHIGLHRLPPVLKAFTQAHPDVSLDIEFTDSELAYEAVHRGEIELAVITLAPQQDPQIHTGLIWPDPLCVAVAPTHTLAKSKQVDLATLSKHPAILPNRSTYTGMIIESLFAQRQLKLNIGMATNYMETIKSMAGIGLGWTIIPESMLDADLVKLPLRDASLHRDLGFIHHKNRHLSNAATAFIETLASFSQD